MPLVNWLTNVALDQHLQSNSDLKQKHLQRDVLIMYPPMFAQRMQLSSCLMVINVLHCLYHGFRDLFMLTLIAALCSLNHWRYPIIGIRRSIDLLSAQSCVIYHLYIAYYHISHMQWIRYFFIGFLGSMVFYTGAIYFGINNNKDYASRCHFMMHIWGICANVYLYNILQTGY